MLRRGKNRIVVKSKYNLHKCEFKLKVLSIDIYNKNTCITSTYLQNLALKLFFSSSLISEIRRSPRYINICNILNTCFHYLIFWPSIFKPDNFSLCYWPLKIFTFSAAAKEEKGLRVFITHNNKMLNARNIRSRSLAVQHWLDLWFNSSG